MRRVVGTLLGIGGVVFMLTGTAVPATGESEGGQVTVFRHEMAPLTTYEDPSGCHKLPADAHVLTNQTEETVRIYGDPFCLTPSLTVSPGYGAHVAPGSGSFSV